MSRAGSHVDHRIAVDKATHFLGTASISFDNLAFTKTKLDRRNVNRIKVLMQDGRACLPEKSNHHISAAIDKDKFDKALLHAEINQEVLLRPTADHARLEFPPDYKLQCFQGYHRVLAAKEVLPPRMRRWIVKLYSSEIRPETRRDFEEERSNEKDIEDGEFYYNIRVYEGVFDATDKICMRDKNCAEKWWALLAGTKGAGTRKTRPGEAEDNKSPKCDRLRQLFRHRDLSAAFDAFRDLPALYWGLRLGAINKLASATGIDEYTAMINDTRNFWYKHVFKGNKSAMAMLDVSSLRALDGTAPGANEVERYRLEGLVASLQILASFHDDDRRQIWENICSATKDRVVPTLWGFFNNLNYLRPVGTCLKQLVDVREHSLRSSLSSIFNPTKGDRCFIQVSPHLCKSILVDELDRFELAYRQLWIYALREYQDLQPESKKKLAGTEFRSANEVILLGLAKLANKLGFRSYKIERLLQKKPHQTMARKHLRAVRVPGSKKSALYEGCVKEVANYYASAWEPKCYEEGETDEDEESDKDIDMETESLGGIIASGYPRSGSGPTRSGLPRFEDHVRDKTLTFIQHLHDPIENNGSHISSFFVLRSLYSQFFSEWEMKINLRGLLADAPCDLDYYLYDTPTPTIPNESRKTDQGREEEILQRMEDMKTKYEARLAKLQELVDAKERIAEQATQRAETAEERTQKELKAHYDPKLLQLEQSVRDANQIETLAKKNASELVKKSQIVMKKEKDEAEAAKKDAKAAKADAQGAKADAEAAKADAEAAKTEAEAAKTEAETAKTEAERAKTEAETAKTEAETAKTEAETAKTEAETAKTEAETAKTEAETAKVDAEAAKAQAKTANAETEEARHRGFGAAVAAETKRSELQTLIDDQAKESKLLHDELRRLRHQIRDKEDINRGVNELAEWIHERHGDVKVVSVVADSGEKEVTVVDPKSFEERAKKWIAKPYDITDENGRVLNVENGYTKLSRGGAGPYHVSLRNPHKRKWGDMDGGGRKFQTPTEETRPEQTRPEEIKRRRKAPEENVKQLDLEQSC